jgi:hypothetical protein
VQIAWAFKLDNYRLLEVSSHVSRLLESTDDKSLGNMKLLMLFPLISRVLPTLTTGFAIRTISSGTCCNVLELIDARFRLILTAKVEVV